MSDKHDSVPLYERRHSRWHEAVLLSGAFQVIAGLLVAALLPAILVWGPSFWQQLDLVRTNTLWTISLSFFVTALILRHMADYTSGVAMAHVLPMTTMVYLIAFAILFLARESYSRPVLLVSWGLTLVWCYAGYFVGRRYRKPKLALLPMVRSRELRPCPALDIRFLSEPDLHGVRYDGIVADLQGAQMTPEWERFLTRCVLARIPVFHVRQVEEGITGMVHIDHLSENETGTLLPSPLYAACKRLMDVVAVLVTLPVTLPLMVLTALAIRLDSPGGALFMQDRVGLGNRDFRIYKFRSMIADAETNGARLARVADDRITRVGRFIRKTRLDELPQLWNVLKGDMSLIGPRPEQRVFVEQFDAEIPFYIYRHVVRPGLTGWAQVMQGYTGNTDETRIKIQYDLYYIKHFSFWLDLLIVFKTVRIVLTGWGAR